MIPSAQYSNANNFIKAAKILNDYYEDRDIRIDSSAARSTPFYHLLSHAIELILKEYLILKHIDKETLKRFSLRHDLFGLLEECHANNIEFISNFENQIMSLSETHKTHVYRYHGSKNENGTFFMAMPSPKDLLWNVEREMKKLYRKIELTETQVA